MLGPGRFSVPEEVGTAEDVGYLPEANTRLDLRSASQFLFARDSGNGDTKSREQARRRQRAAEGVIFFSWLCRQPDPVRYVAMAEPSCFACQVTDWLASPAEQTKPEPQQLGQSPSSVRPVAAHQSESPPQEGLLGKLYRWFFE